MIVLFYAVFMGTGTATYRDPFGVNTGDFGASVLDEREMESICASHAEWIANKEVR